MKSVLNVGGYKKTIAIPAHYAGWKHDLLDIDPRTNADVIMDARELDRLPAKSYDAVYCSHNLEHYHRADGARVLRGMVHVLKDDGFAEIHVPDMMEVAQHITKHGLDLDDTLYQSPSGPILVRDVFFGYSREVEVAGNEFFEHKTGFSPKSLEKFVAGKGFAGFAMFKAMQFSLSAFFFKSLPSRELWTLLNLDPALMPK